MSKEQEIPGKAGWSAAVNRSPDDFESDNDGVMTEDEAAWFAASALSPDDIEADAEYDASAPMRDEQALRLKSLCWRLGESFDPSLTCEAAERRILELGARM